MLTTALLEDASTTCILSVRLKKYVQYLNLHISPSLTLVGEIDYVCIS